MDFRAEMEEYGINFGENFYDEVDITEFTFNYEKRMFYYPCPCGDQFKISLDDLIYGEEVARCPSCSLIVRIIYDETDLKKYKTLIET